MGPTIPRRIQNIRSYDIAKIVHPEQLYLGAARVIDCSESTRRAQYKTVIVGGVAVGESDDIPDAVDSAGVGLDRAGHVDRGVHPVAQEKTVVSTMLVEPDDVPETIDRPGVRDARPWNIDRG